jgi:sulfoquinovosyltransferase
LYRYPPDLIHCSSPGALIWTACHLSEKYRVPLVQSYHTHLPIYIPRYTWAGLVKPMWDCIRMWTKKADVTMVTSSILQDELRGEGCPRLEVWQKGVDTVAFNPKFRSEACRRDVLCGGRPGKVIGCVGRLGAEKNLYDLKAILAKCPEGTNLALIGDGPERTKLEEHFKGTNTTFTGMLLGDDLAAAYASLDVFVMPSESETLGFVVMEAMASGVPVVVGLPLFTKQTWVIPLAQVSA